MKMMARLILLFLPSRLLVWKWWLVRGAGHHVLHTFRRFVALVISRAPNWQRRPRIPGLRSNKGVSCMMNWKGLSKRCSFQTPRHEEAFPQQSVTGRL